MAKDDKNYDPKDASISIGDVSIDSGFASGEFTRIEPMPREPLEPAAAIKKFNECCRTRLRRVSVKGTDGGRVDIITRCDKCDETVTLSDCDPKVGQALTSGDYDFIEIRP